MDKTNIYIYIYIKRMGKMIARELFRNASILLLASWNSDQSKTPSMIKVLAQFASDSGSSEVGTSRG